MRRHRDRVICLLLPVALATGCIAELEDLEGQQAVGSHAAPVYQPPDIEEAEVVVGPTICLSLDTGLCDLLVDCAGCAGALGGAAASLLAVGGACTVGQLATGPGQIACAAGIAALIFSATSAPAACTSCLDSVCDYNHADWASESEWRWNFADVTPDPTSHGGCAQDCNPSDCEAFCDDGNEDTADTWACQPRSGGTWYAPVYGEECVCDHVVIDPPDDGGGGGGGGGGDDDCFVYDFASCFECYGIEAIYLDLEGQYQCDAGDQHFPQAPPASKK